MELDRNSVLLLLACASLVMACHHVPTESVDAGHTLMPGCDLRRDVDAVLARSFADGPIGDPIATSGAVVPDTPRSFSFVALPQSANATTIGYWLAPGEDGRYELSFAVTADLERFTGGTGVAWFFINGSQVDVALDDGSRVSEVRLALNEGYASIGVRLPADQIPDGLSIIHTVGRVETNPADPASVMPFELWLGGVPRLLVNGAVTPVHELDDTAGYSSGAADPGYRARLYYREQMALSGGPLPFIQETAVSTRPDSGSVRLQLVLQGGGLSGCDNLVDTTVVLALLDGVPHPLGDYGERIVARLGRGEQRRYDFDVSGLPVDGDFHRLEFIQLHGLSALPVVAGGFTPWAMPTRKIAVAAWR